jgi:hypothetical protein
VKKIKVFEEFQKSIRTEIVDPEEIVDSLEKGEDCICEGDGCEECNGIGFITRGTID